jgi:hypothetical protein
MLTTVRIVFLVWLPYRKIHVSSDDFCSGRILFQQYFPRKSAYIYIYIYIYRVVEIQGVRLLNLILVFVVLSL